MRFPHELPLCALLLALVAGCVESVSETGRPCPCTTGWTCCESSGRCVPEGGACAPLPEEPRDTVPPAPPVPRASSSGSPTASISVTLDGTAEPGATVELFTTADCSGTPVGSATADGSGGFLISAPLAPNAPNAFHARATDAAGNTSHCSVEPLTVLHDGVAPGAPVLERLTPGPLSRTPQLRIEGVAEPRSTVSLYADVDCADALPVSAIADERGAFGFDLSVERNTSTTFRARSRDAAGNVSPCSPPGLRFTHDDTPPSAPRLLGPTAPSASTSQEAVGEAEPGARVALFAQAGCTGNVLTEGAARPEGTFSLRFVLSANSTATLSSLAVDSAGNTSACSESLSVAHDDIPPSAPNLSWTEPRSPSRLSVTPTVLGSAAQGSTVRVYVGSTTCDASAASRVFTGTTDAQGRFSIPIEVPANATTRLSMRSIDAAGNASWCPAAFQYVHDSLPPVPPTLLTPEEPSPSYSSFASILGTTEPETSIRLHGDATCSDASFLGEHWPQTAVSGALVDFMATYSTRKPGSQVYYATARDVAGNISACSSTSVEFTPSVSPPDRRWNPGGVPSHSREPSLSQNRANEALLLWYGDRGEPDVPRVWAAIERPASGWTEPVILSDAGNVSGVRGALSDNGEAFALWLESPAAGSPQVRVRRFAGEWQPALTLSGDSVIASAPAMGVDSAGNALALWLEASTQEPTKRTVRGSRFASDTGWSAPQSISAASSGLSSVRLSVTARGHAWALWTQGTGTEESLWLSRFTPGGDWSAPERLDLPVLGSSPATYSLGADEQGGAVLAWLERGTAPEARHVKARRYVPGEGWSAPRVLSDAELPTSPPQVAVNARGEALVGWVHPSVTLVEPRVARFTPEAQWSAPVTVQSSPGPTFAAASGESTWLGIDDTGAGLLVWLQSYGAKMLELPPAERAPSVWSSRFEPGSGWGRPQLLSTWWWGGDSYSTVLLRMNGRGDARVYWRFKRSGTEQLGFRDYR